MARMTIDDIGGKPPGVFGERHETLHIGGRRLVKQRPENFGDGADNRGGIPRSSDTTRRAFQRVVRRV